MNKHEKSGSGQRAGFLSDRWLTVAISSASGVFFLLLMTPILRGRTFIAGDLLSQNLPYRKFYADCLHRSESFLWCPFLYGGFYLHGEGQAGMMHPFHLLLYYLLPLKIAFGIEILSTYAFMFGGCYLLFKAWKLCTPAALFGGFLFTFGGTNLDLLRHMNAIAVMAHLPWVLLAIDRVFESENLKARALWLSALALLTGSQVLLGYPQSVYFCALIEGGYVIYLLAAGARWRRLFEVLGALAVGLIIGGAQLLPTLSAVSQSARAAPPIDFLSEKSLMPQELLQWINSLVWEGGRYDQLHGAYNVFIYCGGIVTLLLFVWTLTVEGLEKQRRILTRFLGVLALASIFLALGKYNLLFPFYARWPVIKMFRAPMRYTVLTDFAIAAGAALALDQMQKLRGNFSIPPFAKRLAVFFAVAAIATIGFGFVPKLKQNAELKTGAAFLLALAPHVANPLLIVAGAMLVVTGALLFLASVRLPRISYSGLAIFVLLDVIGIQGMVLLAHNQTGNPFRVADPPPVVAPGPVQVKKLDDQLVLLNYRLVDGWSGLEPTSLIPIRSDIYARVAGARAVWDGTWRVVPDPLPLLRLRNRTVQMVNQDALRLDSYLISQSTLMVHMITPPTLEDDLNQVTKFDFANAALVDAPLSLDSTASGNLEIIEEHPAHMKYVADVSGKMLASVGVRYHTGWKISVDGSPEAGIQVDGSLLGFVVPAGRHIIECRFDPEDFRHGKLMSLFGIFTTFVFVTIVFIRT